MRGQAPRASGRTRTWLGHAAVTLLVGLSSCRRTPDATVGPSDGATAPAEPAAPTPSVATSRCQPAGTGLAVPEPEDLELGNATAWPDGTAIGLVHRAHAGRVAAVGLAGSDWKGLQVVELGPTLGDALPPSLAVRGSELLAAAYGVPEPTHETSSRELRVYVIGATGTTRVLGAIAEPRDDSLAFDLAPGLLVWDESTPGRAAHGVIRAVTVSVEGHLGAAHDVSPPQSDAETPRLVSAGAGYFVLWMARRPEPASPTVDGAPVPESIGEPRTFSWVEMIRVDAAGAPVGPARSLTSTSGHVSAYDVRPLPGEAKPAVLVVARDEGESVDGSGGALLHVRARDEGVDPPLAFPTEGLGRGAPTFVEGDIAPWLAWVDAHETMELLPLDSAGSPAGSPSPEPALEDTSPLLAIGGGRWLVASPADPTTQLQVFTCVR